MPDYKRIYSPGGTYFFTVSLLELHGNDLLIKHIDLLREAVRKVRSKYPFIIHGWVVLPDHLHCIIALPPSDTDFSLRWRLIKLHFSRAIAVYERRSLIRQKRGERGIWQRRFWEHLIRDETEYVAHMDYIHTNPVKHGLVERVQDWPYSTFHRLADQGVYLLDWGGDFDSNILTYND